jgi:hypothetical protein
LTRHVWAPICLYQDTRRSISKPVPLSAGVSIAPLPNWVKHEAALKHLDHGSRLRILESAHLAFHAEYDGSDVSQDSPHLAIAAGPLAERVYHMIYLASLAVWFAKPSTIGFDVVLHFDRDGDPESVRIAVASLERCYFHPWDADSQLTVADFDCARKLHAALLTLREHSTPLTAAQIVARAVRAEMLVSRFILHWVALEALFGPASPGETQYRVSQRIALFLSSTPDDARSMMKRVTESYGWRSKMVHGMHAKGPGDKDRRVAHELEDIVRACFRKLLGDSALPGQFDGRSRDTYLNDLVFRRMSQVT